ncbi:hypothetical protein AVEN_171463-1 [Araneus ventricosus]|uniref:Uncharacterized protein n=1 Tax=Araneus ventricosus TaxID=182803 RepID=A0A4Y2I0K2_ARAVE|nr:hypothetical protein AVEN_171463-1 [Araneus ventricosus]
MKFIWSNFPYATFMFSLLFEDSPRLNVGYPENLLRRHHNHHWSQVTITSPLSSESWVYCLNCNRNGFHFQVTVWPQEHLSGDLARKVRLTYLNCQELRTP